MPSAVRACGCGGAVRDSGERAVGSVPARGAGRARPCRGRDGAAGRSEARRAAARRGTQPRLGRRGDAGAQLAGPGEPARQRGGQARAVAATARAAPPRMSAVAADSGQAARARPMREDDLDAVMEIERRAYPFPWTRGIFRDCLRAGYPAWVLEDDGVLAAYGLLSVAVGEAHILNLCSAPE